MRGGGALALLLAACLALAGAPAPGSAQDVACTGVVQISPESQLQKLEDGSDSPLSSVTLELRTREGAVEATAQCSSDGRFSIPVKGAGKRVVAVTGPEGWSFEPSQVEVSVDGKACHGGKDISLQHTGFSVSGRVLGSRGVGPACESGAPAGIQVALSGGTLKAPLSATTGPDGAYAFQGLAPGKYELKASHPKWRIEELGTPEVELASGGVKVPDLFRVAGYDLSGTVQAEGKGVPGVPVYLYSQRYKKLAACQLDPSEAPLRPGSKALCQAVSDDSGAFSFPELFCGEYELVAQGSLGDLELEISPAALNVSLAHASLVAEQPFKVLSFALTGLVADSVGAGVPEADVLVNGKVAMRTDARGYFKLPNLKSSTLTLSAQKPHYHFSDVTRLPVSPSTRSLPPVTATSYDLCAQVSLDKDSTFSRKRKVTLSGGQKPQTGITDKDGSVCFQVFPGEYSLAVEVSASEAEAGLLFEPQTIPISLVARPLTRNSFTQAHLSVSGHVGCIEECDGRERLTLAYLGPPQGGKAPKGPAPGNLTSHVDPQTSSFKFDRVPEGRYRLSVYKETRPVAETKGAATMDTDEWCWEGEGAVEVEVKDKGVEGVSFQQTGFRMVIQSTVEDHADLLTPGASGAFDVKVGRNEMCYNSPGEYQLFFMDGCYYYGWLSLGWSTHVPFKILLDPVWYLIRGLAYVKTKDVKWANNLTDHVFAPIHKANGEKHNALYYMYAEKPATKKHKTLSLRWKYFGAPHEEGFVQPHHDGLFNPNFKSEEQVAEEQKEKARKDKEREYQVLRDNGFGEDDIRQLEQDLARRQAGGEEYGSILQLAGLAHLLPPPEGQDGQDGQPGIGQEMDEEEQQAAQEKAYGKLEGDKPRLLEEVQEEEERKREKEKEKEKEEEEKKKKGGEAGEGDSAAQGEAPEEGYRIVEEDYDEEMEMYQEPGYVPEHRPFPPLRRVLFYPKRRWFKLGIHGCPADPPPFAVRWGVYLEGTIDPPISGVNVTVVVDKESKAAEWAVGETVEWGLSHEGQFKVGPLYDDATYHLEAFKEGWVFTPSGNNSFTAEQKASLHVSFTGAPTAKPKGVPRDTISPVLTLTSKAGGEKAATVVPGQNYSFLGLEAGAYTLTPELEEYQFDPPSLPVTLGKGEQASVAFHATRVSFSVSGRVLSAEGERQGSVAVEAIAKDGTKHRGAMTHHRGYYRIAGLTPGVEYSIQVLTKGKKAVAAGALLASEFKLASPPSRELVMPAEDVYDHDFVVFDKDPAQLSLTYTEHNPSTWRQYVEVQVIESPTSGSAKAEDAKVVQSVVLSTVDQELKFVAFRGLPPKKYTVRLAFQFPGGGSKFELVASELEADLTNGKALHAGNLHFQVREKGADQQCDVAVDGAKICKW